MSYSLHQKKVSTCGKAKYSKTRVCTGKVGCASDSKWSWSKVDQALTWYSKRWRHKNKMLSRMCTIRGPSRLQTRWGNLSSRFLLVCRHFFEFQNEAWPSLDQLNGWFGAPPTFHLALLSFEYSARQKCIVLLSFGGDCRADFRVSSQECCFFACYNKYE